MSGGWIMGPLDLGSAHFARRRGAPCGYPPYGHDIIGVRVLGPRDVFRVLGTRDVFRVLGIRDVFRVLGTRKGHPYVIVDNDDTVYMIGHDLERA